MTNRSLADEALDAVQAVRNMTANVDSAHPESYAVRKMEQLAGPILFTAFNQARDLVFAAEQLQLDIRKTEAEQRAQAQKDTK